MRTRVLGTFSATLAEMPAHVTRHTEDAGLFLTQLLLAATGGFVPSAEVRGREFQRATAAPGPWAGPCGSR